MSPTFDDIVAQLPSRWSIQVMPYTLPSSNLKSVLITILDDKDNEILYTKIPAGTDLSFVIGILKAVAS